MIKQQGSIINIGPDGRRPQAGRQRALQLHQSGPADVQLLPDLRGAAHNIAVNILSPGGLRSEGSAAIPWTQRDWHLRVEPEEVGPSAVYLALQDAKSMTGQLVLRADFGKTWGL